MLVLGRVAVALKFQYKSQIVKGYINASLFLHFAMCSLNRRLVILNMPTRSGPSSCEDRVLEVIRLAQEYNLLHIRRHCENHCVLHCCPSSFRLGVTAATSFSQASSSSIPVSDRRFP